jgi:periplasmic divalent cation tolerance protein
MRIVLVTAPDLKTARRLARAALRERLAACANLIPGLASLYWWRGKIASSREVLILFKTRAALLPDLERLILAAHPYDTPEFVVLQLTAGTKRYLDWLAQETRQHAGPINAALALNGGSRGRGRGSEQRADRAAPS